jgi:hypothetical protein
MPSREAALASTDDLPDTQPPSELGVYGISVAAGLSGAPVQSIRLW